MLVHIARRLQTLVTRALDDLSALENEVEDPVLLHGLFQLDHLVTRIRRQGENLAVLGGAVPRRFTQPVPLATVLRTAVAEIEKYPQVRIPALPEGALHGHVAADVTHLLAELVENATLYSPPTAQVLMRAAHVPAGLAVEIEDRALPMSAEKLARMNTRLASPDQYDIAEQLRSGQIGLYVVAQLARRHQITVKLGPSVYGGTLALVILPADLLSRENKAEAKSPAEAAPEVAQTTTAPTAVRATGDARPRPAVVPAATAASASSGHSEPPQPSVSALSQRHSPPRAATGSAHQPEDSTRPRLPQRGSPARPATPAPELDDREAVAPDPGLMARFASGTRRQSARATESGLDES